MATPEIMFVLQARSKWRGTVHLADDILSKVDVIRAEIRSGEDPKGWQTVGTFRQSQPRSGRFGALSTDSKTGAFRSWRPSYEQPRFHRGGGASASAPAPAPAPVRYISRFRNTEDTVENVVVNTIIQGKLNKFSVANYEDVREFLMEILATGDKEFLGDFMKLIFQKAATEPTFCGIYAKLLFELSSRFDFLRAEMDSLYGQFLHIFEEVAPEAASGEAFLQRNKDKKYRLGYSQFIGELFKYNIIGNEQILSTIRTIVEQMCVLIADGEQKATIEEYADCLLKMLRVMATGHLASCVGEIRAHCAEHLATLKIMGPPGLSNKTRFTIMDVERLIE